MKNIISIGILIIALSSCEKFLDVTPELAVTDANFYASQKDFEQAVIGAYQPLQTLYQQHWQLTELRSDNTFFMYNTQNRGGQVTEDVATFTVKSNSIPIQVSWMENYRIIERANAVIKYIDVVDFDQTIKDNLKGQALFLRALSYFDLVKNFGGVPIFLDPPANYDETIRPRATVADVYDQIIIDATDAAGLLPGKTTQSIGRATSGAAYTLLADVYITMEQWADAETALNPITTMGYSLLPNYEDIFKPTNKYNNEMIFEIGYITGSSQPLYSSFPYSFLPDLNDPSVITGVVPSSRGGGAWNTPTPDLIAAYQDTINDERYSASIGHYTGASPRLGVTYNWTPYIKKYLHPHAVFNQTDQNWPVYRYAEVLLMMAECLNEQDDLLGGLGYLNQVRDRAGLGGTSAASKSELRDKIFQERQIELAFENKRWADLVRSGKAVSVMNAFGVKVKATPEAYYYPVGSAPTISSFTVTVDHMIYPIPVHEITVNPTLQQNPGY